MRNILRISIFLLAYFNVGAMDTSTLFKKSDYKNPVEKIELHPDRFLYLSGEIILFSAYYFDNEQDSNLLKSTVLYVELFDCNNRSILRKKYEITNGVVSGALEIPEDLTTGNYILRAYTQYMRNTPPENYSYSYITIINPLFTPQNNTNKTNKNFDIVIEGGALIPGYQSKIAFRLDEVLNRKVINVFVTDQNQNVVTKVKPFTNGLGLLKITPVDSLKYFIKLSLNNGDTIIKNLHQKGQKGITIFTERSDSLILLNVICDELFLDNNGHYYNLAIFSQQSEKLYESQIYLKDEKNKIIITSDKLENGINYISLLNNEDKFIYINVIYHHNQKEEILIIETTKKKYSKRDKVEVDLLNNNKGIADFKHLTISVVKKGTVPTSIRYLPEFLISNPRFVPQLLSTIGKPDSMLLQQIDISMILFNYKISQGKQPFFFNKTDFQTTGWVPEIKGITISGIIRDKKHQTPVSGAHVFVSVFGEDQQIHVNETSENGRFIFSLNHLTNNQDIYLCLKPGQTQNAEILINNDFSNIYPDLNLVSFSIDNSDKKFLEEMYINSQVMKKFNLNSVKYNHDVKHITKIFGRPEISVVLSDYVKLNSIREVFKEIVPYAIVRKKDSKYKINVMNSETRYIYEEPLILVDNLPVFDIEEIMKIHPANVESIEVINKPYIHGDYIFNGVILIKTNTDNFAGIKFSDESVFIDYTTITPSAQYISPQYDTEKKRSCRRPDFRNLLYWNPNVVLDNTISPITFYCSDHCSEYDIIIRGITKNGAHCFGITSFNVSE